VNREYAPAGPDGENEGWPWAGQYYCCDAVDRPTSRWYELEQVGIEPSGGVWLAWERCDPPRGYRGAPAAEELLEGQPLPSYEGEDEDTIPEVTI
jgi:hypothetical protein